MKKLILLLILAFTCVLGLTACDKEEPAPELSKEVKNGLSFIKTLYEKASSETASDYTVVGKAALCDVTWTVTVTKGEATDVKVVVEEDGTVKIDVNEQTATDVEYTLTATVTYNGQSSSLSYQRKIPAFKELTYAEYAATEAGKAVVVKGIVVGILSKDLGDNDDCLYLHTPQGGFYVYQIANTEAIPMSEYKLGMEVRASGTMDVYSGTLEVKSATCEILNATPVSYEAVDITEKFTAAEDISLEKIGVPQAMLVTIKDVTISDIDASNGYYNFTLGGKKSYLRISSSNCPLNAADTATFKEEWAAHAGYTADVTGVVSIYNGNLYLQPVTLESAADYKSLPQLSDADAVAYEKGLLKLDQSKFVDGAEIELPSTGSAYKDVAITWTSNSENVVIENGVAKVTVGNSNIDLQLTATLSRNDATDTQPISFTIFAKPITVTELAATTKGTQVLVKGVITEMVKAEYGNLYISDGKTSFYVYGVYNAEGKKHGDWAAADQLAVGDVVTLLGTADEYQGTPQLGGKATLISVSRNVALDKVADIEKGTTIAVTGTVKEMVKAEYGNLYIEDKNGNTLYIYGVNNFAGVKHGDWTAADQLAVGDVITVEGARDEYKGTIQIKSSTLISAAGAPAEKPALTTDFTTTDYQTLKDMVDATTTDTTEAYYAIGYVKSITGAQYGNMTIEDAEGNTLDIYGTYSCDGNIRFDALPFEVKVGDVVVLYGKMNHYADKSVDQMKNAKLVQLGTTVLEADDEFKSAVVANSLTAPEKSTDNFTLTVSHAKYSAVTVVWSSNNAAIAVSGANATVTRPAVGEEDAVVTLTATVTSGTVVKTKTFTVTVAALVDLGEATETTYSHTLKSGDFSGLGTKTLSGVSWTHAATFAAGSGYWGWDSNDSAKGVQFGSKKSAVRTMTLTSASFDGVTKVVVNASGASGFTGTLSVSVNGTVLGTVSLTTTATDYEFTSETPISGEVVITISQPSTTKGAYVKSMAVTYLQ